MRSEDHSPERVARPRLLALGGTTLLSVAGGIVEQSAWVLAGRQAELLCIPLAAPRDQESDIVALDRSFTRDPNPWADSGAEAGLLGALRRAAAQLQLEIAPLWPRHTFPLRLSLLCDGTGLGFSPEDPCPLAAGWLARQIRGQTGLTEIVSFSAAGAWSSLTRRGSNAELH